MCEDAAGRGKAHALRSRTADKQGPGTARIGEVRGDLDKATDIGGAPGRNQGEADDGGIVALLRIDDLDNGEPGPGILDDPAALGQNQPRHQRTQTVRIALEGGDDRCAGVWGRGGCRAGEGCGSG